MLKGSLSRKIWLAWAALGVGLLATVFASLQVKQNIEHVAASQFAFTCDQVTLKIQERLDAYALILRGGAALFAASNAVDRKEWRAYVETLRADENVPGVQGIGFVQVIPADRLATHIANIRAQGFPEYTVRPLGERAIYTSVVYLEPFRDRNLRAFGFDMFSEPVRRAAMEQARDTGEAALSGKVHLVQETNTEVQAGALMYVPVYRNGMPRDTVGQRRAALIGWTSSPYRMNDLMTGILRDWSNQEGKTVDLQIYDGLQATPASLLFDSKPANSPDLHSLFYQRRTIDFNGQQWLMEFDQTSTPSGISYAPAWADLTAGLALSSLLFGLMLSMINTRADAVRIAEGLTEEIRHNQELLKESESKLSEILENVDACIYLKDTQGRYLFANRLLCELFGASMDEVVGQSYERFFDAETVAQLRISDRLVLEEGETLKTDSNLKLKDGRTSTHLSVKVPLRNEAGEIYALCGISTDITERKQAEEKLYLAASVFTHAREGIMITTADGIIIDVNDAFSDITGYSRDEVQGRNPHLLSSGRQEKAFYADMWRDLIEQGSWCGEVWNRRKNGELFAVMQTISAVRDAQGNTRHYVALLTDITSLKEHERRLEHIAHFDALTSLPNRVLLADRLHQAMVQAQRRGQQLAVAFLDLDGFKAINDNNGHEAGDQLLIATAARMKQALREGDTLARMGGDEFVAVLPDLADIDASVPMLTRLLDAAAQPVHVGDLLLQVSASLGVTIYPQAVDIDADQLLRQADQAMYQAKLEGKNRYHFFDTEQDSRIRNHHESLVRIRRALAEREFLLYYQPKVNMRTGTVLGAEALLRWQHPEKGLLLPAVFLPAIEDHPLAVELGEWVIDSVLTQMERWHAEGLDIPVSVNVCARQLQQTDFVERLRAQLAAHPGVRPGDLVMEVLETSALQDLAKVSRVINACREIGVMFALDDFGTGYSSLTYLKRLPVTQLKIDQTFVSSMLDSPDDLAILEGVLGMAAAFHHQVIAEGVETVEHGEMLLQFDCELAQGYGIARPMPAHEMSGWSAAWRTDPSWVGLPAVSREDFPMLVASADHRAWVAALEAFLKGERAVPPPMDRHQCRFGMWLDAKGLDRYGGQPAFEALELLHRQVHVLGAELLELQARGRNPKALARLGELHGLRDALLKKLKTLMQESQQ